jgi:4-hydroxybenzoate polyprenyltransferase
LNRALPHRSGPRPGGDLDRQQGSGALPLLRATRPEQWVKNFFVFAALLFGGKLGDAHAVGQTLLAFAIFCALSGGVYLVNDLRDLEADRLHPVKRRRPLASGALAPRTAVAACTLLLLGGLAAGFLLLPDPFGLCALAYILLNLAYSFGLKNVVILDVLAVAAGFVLRAVAGAVAIPVEFSQWLVLCTLLLALFLGFGKRRHELTLLTDGASSHRASLKEYSLGFLDQMIAVVLSATVVAYCLYTMSPDVASKLHTPWLPLTIPFVLYGIFRYLFLIHHRSEGGSPTRALFTDLPLLIDVALWAAAVGIILYAR